MDEKKTSAGGGIGVTGLLQVAFIVLKLCKVINWNWWWVLAPTWIDLSIVALFFFGIFVVWVIRIICQNLEQRKRRKHD